MHSDIRAITDLVFCAHKVSGLPFGVSTLTDELYGDFVPELVTVCGLMGGNCNCSVSESLCFSCFTEELFLAFDEVCLGGSSFSGLVCFSTTLLFCFSSSL